MYVAVPLSWDCRSAHVLVPVLDPAPTVPASAANLASSIGFGLSESAVLIGFALSFVMFFRKKTVLYDTKTAPPGGVRFISAVLPGEAAIGADHGRGHRVPQQSAHGCASDRRHDSQQNHAMEQTARVVLRCGQSWVRRCSSLVFSHSPIDAG